MFFSSVPWGRAWRGYVMVYACWTATFGVVLMRYFFVCLKESNIKYLTPKMCAVENRGGLVLLLKHLFCTVGTLHLRGSISWQSVRTYLLLWVKCHHLRFCMCTYESDFVLFLQREFKSWSFLGLVLSQLASLCWWLLQLASICSLAFCNVRRTWTGSSMRSANNIQRRMWGITPVLDFSFVTLFSLYFCE